MANNEEGAEKQNISAPKELWEQIDAACDREHRDRSNVVQLAMMDWLKQHHSDLFKKLKNDKR